MYKHILFIVSVLVLSSAQHGCMSEKYEEATIYIRNTTGSLLSFHLERDNFVWNCWVLYPTSISVQKNKQYDWSLADTSGTIASGTIYLDCDKWLLVEEDNGEWTCTWSNEPLW